MVLIDRPHERLSLEDIDIKQSGFMYIYLSSEDQQNMDVYFDDLKITHSYTNVVAGSDFYPFGLTMKTRDINREKYRYGYQGQNSEEDEETGWNSFELRMYDPVVGRWTSTDPMRQYFNPYNGNGNNPISNVDPTGGLNPIVSSNGVFRGFDEFGAGGEAIVYDGDFTEGMSQDVILDDGGSFFSTFADLRGFTSMEFNAFQTIANRTYKNYINATALIATGELIQDISLGLSFMTGGGSSNTVRGASTRLSARGIGNIIPEGKLANHLFKGVNKLADTPANRTLIADIANGKSLGMDVHGKSWFARTLSDGRQIYTYAQNGIVKGAGINKTSVDLVVKYGLK